jgi:hypothetical protein
MPATIIGNSEWTLRGLVLTAQNAQEQVNGLVNVQVEYTAPATKQQKIDQLFYVDAPPPIWPSVVNRGEMLTNNIYMVTRSVERANGLVRVRAEYVSGLKRSGFRGYFLRETVETGKRGQAYNYVSGDGGLIYTNLGIFDTLNQLGSQGITISNISANAFAAAFRAVNVFGNQGTVPTPGGGNRSVGYASSFIFDERIKTVEFVRIGGQRAGELPIIKRSDVASILTQDRGGVYIPFGANAGLFSNAPEQVNSADLWVASGPPELLATGVLSFEKDTPVSFTETWDYVTPNVQIVTLTYRLTR